MNLRERMRTGRLYLDGGMGTLLQAAGLRPGELPERWNLTQAPRITQIHRAYYDAGSNIVCTNTFGANPLKYAPQELEQIIRAAVQNARLAAQTSTGRQEKYLALDIGPLGRLLQPYGDLDFEEAVSLFAATVRLGAACGVDLVLIETMNDSYETKAAVLAAKENCDLPVLVSNAYGEDGRLMTGASPQAMAALLEGLGADAIGVNCSQGPQGLLAVAKQLLAVASVPVFAKPNAGLPRQQGQQTVYDVTPQAFAEQMTAMAKAGVQMLGGCCGTTPDYIRALVAATEEIPFQPPVPKELTVVASYTHSVQLGRAKQTAQPGQGEQPGQPEEARPLAQNSQSGQPEPNGQPGQLPVLIGERINPTGKKRLRQALQEGDMDYLLQQGIAQQEAGAHILDVNVGLPGAPEIQLLTRAVTELQAVVDLPLQLDTADVDAMAAALRVYNGKALVNSVNGKAASMRAVFPLVKKYGGVVVALTLDEGGIPATAEGRVAIAQKILATARDYGLDKKDLLFDPLCLAVSAEPEAANITLAALQQLRQLGLHTVLGVSNISFGLPRRPLVNAAFFTLALENGLCAAIVDPLCREMMQAYHGFLLLRGLDENCEGYIRFAETLPPPQAAQPVAPGQSVPPPDGLAGTVANEPTAALASGGAVDTLTPSPTVAAGPTAPTPGGVAPVAPGASTGGLSPLMEAVVKGRREHAGALCAQALQHTPPLRVVDEQIIPALDLVGRGFETKTVYLPQLLMSAEAAKSAFEKVKEAIAASGSRPQQKAVFVLATVQGDIHDIGKNIVRILLENYGFSVIDLGRDVPPQTVVEAVVRYSAPLCGLSALMTTTVPAMEETIRQLRRAAPACRVVVGGAVLNEGYARRIGADHYAKDAMETVRYALRVAEETEAAPAPGAQTPPQGDA